MTEAMPFLQKTILLSYDPRPLWRGFVQDFLSVLVLFLDLFDYLVGDRFAVADDEDAEG